MVAPEGILRQGQMMIDLLWGPLHVGEIIAYRKKGEKTYSWWFPVGFRKLDEKLVANLIKANDQGYSIALSVNPRIAAHKKTTEDVPAYCTIVFDWDSMEAASAGIGKLSKLGIALSATVRSGRGMHGYVRLTEPRLNNGLPWGGYSRACVAVGSDPVHDATRVLRVPGTFNHRAGQMCEIESYNPEVTIEYQRIDEVFPSPVQNPPPPVSLPARSGSASSKIAAALKGNFSMFRSKSEATYSVAMSLRRNGMTQVEAKAIMMGSALAERGEKDINRCLDKVYSIPMVEPVSTQVVIHLFEKHEKMFRVKLEALDGEHKGKTWWDGVFPEVQDAMLRCFLTVQAMTQGGGNFRGQTGYVVLSTRSYRGQTQPTVVAWLPKG